MKTTRADLTLTYLTLDNAQALMTSVSSIWFIFFCLRNRAVNYIVNMLMFERKGHLIYHKWLSCGMSQKHLYRTFDGRLKKFGSYTRWRSGTLDTKKNYKASHNVTPLSSMIFSLTNRSRRLLSLQNPCWSQVCSYHSIQSCVRIHDRNGERNILSLSNNLSSSFNIEKRRLSFEWLDSLAVTQAGWFQSLSHSQLVESLMGVLQVIHDTLHIPWWMSIIVSTLLLRGIITFPFAVYQNYIFAKIENLKPEMDGLVKELKRETAIAIKKFGWKESHARLMYNKSAKRMWKELIIRENCHPFKASLLLWVQLPFWVAMSVSFRNMASMMPHQDAAAQVLFLELSTGGFLWIPNLTEVDHSFILPVAMGLTNLLITEVNVMSRIRPGSRAQNIMTNIFRGISIAVIPIAATVPSCITLYWVTSSVCGLLQNLALMHPGVRQLCRIPRTPSQIDNPYQHLWNQFQKKLSGNK